jgi:plastocyanin
MPWFPLLLILAAVLLAGCNRGDVAVAPDRTVEIRQEEYRFVPQRVRVKPGRVTFTVHNGSSEAHTFQLKRRGRVTARISSMLPGESETVRARLRRGTYRMYCGIGHHEQLGEYGTVSVR